MKAYVVFDEFQEHKGGLVVHLNKDAAEEHAAQNAGCDALHGYWVEVELRLGRGGYECPKCGEGLDESQLFDYGDPSNCTPPAPLPTKIDLLKYRLPRAFRRFSFAGTSIKVRHEDEEILFPLWWDSQNICFCAKDEKYAGETYRADSVAEIDEQIQQGVVLTWLRLMRGNPVRNDEETFNLLKAKMLDTFGEVETGAAR